jgi:hypothetical protein
MSFRPGIGKNPDIGPSYQEAIDNLQKKIKSVKYEKVLQNPDLQWPYVYILKGKCGRDYIGSRFGPKVMPCGDPNEVDVKYLGSFSDDTFEPIEKIILLYFHASKNKRAQKAEGYLHEIWQVRDNLHFANKGHANEEFSFAGRKHSNKSKIKISESLKKRLEEPLLRQKWSNAQKGKKLSEETKLKISRATTGKKKSEETKLNMSKAQKGKIISQETKIKLSEIMKKTMSNLEARERISKANKGKKVSEETKWKISIAKKGKPLSEETKLKISNSQKGKKLSQETKIKISITMKTKHFQKKETQI